MNHSIPFHFQLTIGFVLLFFIHQNHASAQFKNDIDPQVVGTWVMVKKEKAGQTQVAESITEGYTTTYSKNGDFIFDFRIVSEATSSMGMSIMDMPRMKWKAYSGQLELVAYTKNGMPISPSQVNRYFFKSDTLVIVNHVFTQYYLLTPDRAKTKKKKE
ncbi:hypothetical protein [Algoriphagus namhaensis]